MTYLVKGIDDLNKRFEVSINFRIEDSACFKYGNDKLLIVETPFAIFNVDLRCSKNLNIDYLAKSWIHGFYGSRVKEIIKK